MCQQPHITRVQAGFERNDDFNAERQEGFGYYQMNIQKGRRWSTARGYLAPARRHANLRIVIVAQIYASTAAAGWSDLPYDRKETESQALAKWSS